jgi:hypothetical protein
MSETLTAALIQAKAALTLARKHVSFERASCPPSELWKFDYFDKALTDLAAITASDFAALGRTPPTVEDAYLMGTKGAPHSDAERALFEEYMRGHCWLIVGPWDDKQQCYPDMLNRIEFAVWRDRAALGVALPAEAPAPPPCPVGAGPQFEQPFGDHRLRIDRDYIGCLRKGHADQIMRLQTQAARASQLETALALIAFGDCDSLAANPMMWPSTVAYTGLGGRFEQGQMVDGPANLLVDVEVRNTLLPEFLAKESVSPANRTETRHG